MRLSSLFLAFSILLCAAGASAWVAVWTADWLETRSLLSVELALGESHLDWVVVDTDGLQVKLTGIADSEAERFDVVSAVAKVIDGSRIIDLMEVVEQKAPPPEFAIEILRGPDGISLIGLIPEAFDTTPLFAILHEANAPVTDLLQSADFPIPAGFEVAADFAARAALKLPNSKISVSATRVSVAATTDSQAAKQKAQGELAKIASDSFILALDIRAPRPVVTPFALRFLRDDAGARFDVCTADSVPARDAIRKAAVRAGLSGKADCTIGLGAPTPDWGAAAVQAIDALAELGAGSVTFRDADVSIVAAETVDKETFDRVTGALQEALPPPFSLHARLTKPAQAKAQQEKAEFLATLDREGQLQMRGRIDEDATAQAVTGFAAARFGAGNVHDATQASDGLPNGWPLRVLAGLDALSQLASGSVEVTEDHVAVKGATGAKETRAAIAALLAEKLGDGGSYDVDVSYEESLDPLAGLPTPEECLERVKAVQAHAKISFEPGKATIDEDGLKIIDTLATALTDCENVAFEVGGHTDSQGRESMNLSLSQTRAEAVIDALLARRVLTGNLIARGYGESAPIADNGTEEGREANRRIEFRLLTPEEAQAARGAELTPDAESEDTNEQN